LISHPWPVGGFTDGAARLENLVRRFQFYKARFCRDLVMFERWPKVGPPAKSKGWIFQREFKNASMLVDYVRVWELDDRSQTKPRPE